MDAKKLEILTTAVDLGSFSKASEVVGYTQSGLTHLVDSMEKEMGVKLIKRDSHGISLTEQGKKLMPSIREYLRANAVLENKIKTLTESTSDAIRIASYSSITIHWLPEILYRFRRICPDVTVNMRMVDNALEPFELLEKGEADVIFASKQNYSFCEWTPLYEEKMFAVLPKDYPITEPEFPLTAFENQDFLMPYGKFVLDVNSAMNKVGIKIKSAPLHVDDETVINMVSHGLGVSMMSELMIKGRTNNVTVLPVTPTCLRELGFGVFKGSELSDSVKKLKKCVLEFISEMKQG